MMHCLKNVSRQFVFGCTFLKFFKVLSEQMNLTATLRDQIGQSPNQEIPFGAKPLHLTLMGYPLVSQDLKNLADLLEHLPSQAPALFALPETFINIHICSLERLRSLRT